MYPAVPGWYPALVYTLLPCLYHTTLGTPPYICPSARVAVLHRPVCPGGRSGPLTAVGPTPLDGIIYLRILPGTSRLWIKAAIWLRNPTSEVSVHNNNPVCTARVESRGTTLRILARLKTPLIPGPDLRRLRRLLRKGGQSGHSEASWPSEQRWQK